MEIWKEIEEAPDYSVSNMGRVRRMRPDRLGRLPGRPLATPLNDKGYPNLNLHFGGRQHLRRVHQLVCTAFHGPKPTPNHEVRHLDGNPTNNTAENLAWGTSSDNKFDIVRHGKVWRDRNPLLLNTCFVSEVFVSQGSLSSVARRFGVNMHIVRKVRNDAPRLLAGLAS